MPNRIGVLVHPETVAAAGGERAYQRDFGRWAELYGQPHIVHFNGRSWLDTPCSSCKGDPRPAVGSDLPWCAACRVVVNGIVSHTGSDAQHPRIEVFDKPDDHLNGACFECSGVTPPAMWSQQARRDYLANGFMAETFRDRAIELQLRGGRMQ